MIRRPRQIEPPRTTANSPVADHAASVAVPRGGGGSRSPSNPSTFTCRFRMNEITVPPGSNAGFGAPEGAVQARTIGVDDPDPGTGEERTFGPVLRQGVEFERPDVGTRA
jgi:hypothetical protein